MTMSFKSTKEIIETRLAQMKHAESIWCPRCGEKQENDDYQYPVSYHGMENGPQEIECQYCEKPFWVIERVSRTYESAIDPRKL